MMNEAAYIESQRLVGELESARKAALLAAEKLKHERIHNEKLNHAQKEMLASKERKLREQEKELERKREYELERREREINMKEDRLEERERRRSVKEHANLHGRTPSMGQAELSGGRHDPYDHRNSTGLSPNMRTLGLGGASPRGTGLGHNPGAEGLSPLMDRGEIVS
jgi:hypothetical protein